MHWSLMTANDAIVSCDGPALCIGYTLYPPLPRNAIIFVIDTGTIFKKLEVQSTYYIPKTQSYGASVYDFDIVE